MSLTNSRGLDKETIDRRRTEALLKLGKGYVFKSAEKAEIWDTLNNDKPGLCAALRPFDLTYKCTDLGDVGFAYLVPLGESEGGQGLLKVSALPVLTSYIFVILRRTYQKFAEEGRMGKAVIKRSDLDNQLADYAGETTDWEANKRNVDLALKKMAKWKIIQIVNGKVITIHPIIADLINARWLMAFDEYLEAKKEEVYEEEKVQKGPGKKGTIDEEEDALFDMTEEEE